MNLLKNYCYRNLRIFALITRALHNMLYKSGFMELDLWIYVFMEMNYLNYANYIRIKVVKISDKYEIMLM